MSVVGGVVGGVAHQCDRCWGGDRSGMALTGLALVRELGWHRCLAGGEVL